MCTVRIRTGQLLLASKLRFFFSFFCPLKIFVSWFINDCQFYFTYYFFNLYLHFPLFLIFISTTWLPLGYRKIVFSQNFCYRIFTRFICFEVLWVWKSDFWKLFCAHACSCVCAYDCGENIKHFISSKQIKVETP